MGIFSDINEVTLLGNATANPEVKVTKTGTKVATINIATSRSYKVGEEWKKEATFLRVVLWANLAEQAEARILKGTRLLVKGRISVSSWDDQKTGTKVWRTEVVANDFILIDRYVKKDGTQHGEPQGEPAPTPSATDANIDPNDLPF